MMVYDPHRPTLLALTYRDRRFLDHQEKDPIGRSFCGTRANYLQQKEKIQREEAQRAKLQNVVTRKKKKTCSKVVLLKKYMSSRASKFGKTSPEPLSPTVVIKSPKSIMEDSDPEDNQGPIDTNPASTIDKSLEANLNICVPTHEVPDFALNQEITFREGALGMSTQR